MSQGQGTFHAKPHIESASVWSARRLSIDKTFGVLRPPGEKHATIDKAFVTNSVSWTFLFGASVFTVERRMDS